MNLSEFLNAVDGICKSAGREDLENFIHEFARSLSTGSRNGFLDLLQQCTGDKVLDARPDQQQNFTVRYERIKENLTKIEDGELGLEGSLNEEYDDWYNSDADEFLYEDPSGIGQMICEACEFLSECVEHGEYELGNDIAEILLGLEIQVGGEYQDYAGDPLEINELPGHRVADFNYDEMVICALRLAYGSFPLEDRADVLYHMISSSKAGKVTLETVMQKGEELPEFDAFLRLWVSYLGNITGRRAQVLLEEALGLTNDAEFLLENARIYVDRHPGLYEKYLKSRKLSDSDGQIRVIGMEALQAIDPKYLARSRVAVMMLPAVGRLEDWNLWDVCLLEAFRSDSTVRNYMNLKRYCHDFSSCRHDLTRICADIYHHIDPYSYYRASGNGELEENHADVLTAYMLAFLEGDFVFVLEQGMGKREALGWSGTFMKCGLAAFLLLLLESDTLPVGCRAMCQIVDGSVGFSASRSLTDVMQTVGNVDKDDFWTNFLFWKKSLTLAPEQRETFLRRMEQLIAVRVQGIMDANRRNYYDECAAYVAAMGEVRESGGERNGKQRFMQKCCAQYSRRSAFRRELKNYGMNA
ncbi:MAG: hypothetical protein LIO96_13560 [Lachnospiraceae bacterium]|nr:hypothetical protein [Lachnospiraceae bacterium]